MHIAEAWHTCDRLTESVAAEFAALVVTCIRDVYGRCSFSLETQDDMTYERAVQWLEAQPALREPAGPDSVRPFLTPAWLQRLEPDSSLGKLVISVRKPLPGGANAFIVERLLSNESWLQGAGQNPDGWPPIVGFYSFKGGVGRSTAAAVTALTLAREGKRVALIDFDFEAPGIEGFFFEMVDGHDAAGAPPETRAGVVDYLLERSIIGSDYAPDMDHFVLPFADPAIAASGGSLLIVPAARIDDSYMERLGRINLSDIARKQGMDNPLRVLIGDLVEWRATDVVIVDCRTGFTDLGGMTLNGLADLDVLVFRAGEADRRYLSIVLAHILRFRQVGDVTPEIAEQLARSFLVVFTMVELPGKAEEAEAYVTELREAVSRACWEHIFHRFKDSPYTYPSVAAQDTPYEPVPHDAVLIPYLRDFFLVSSVSDMLRLQAERPEKPYDVLARRLWDVKLAQWHGPPAWGEEGASVQPPASSALRQRASEAIARLADAPESGREFSGIDDFRTKFLPRAAYRALLDPKAFVVLGRKGTGKSALFQLLRHPEYLRDVTGHLGLDSAVVSRTEWEVGFAQGPGFPENQHFLDALTAIGSDPDRLAQLWKMFLALRLAEVRKQPLPGLRTIADCIRAITNSEIQESVSQWLERLNADLDANQQFMCLSYDELDTGLSDDPRRRSILISALVAYWQRAPRYYPRIRAKIFLREDIWQREVNITDKAKIRDGIDRATITWDGIDIYRAVLKRLCHDRSVRELLGNEGLWTMEFDQALNGPVGFIPPADDDWIRKCIHVLAGATMGAGESGHKKGYVYTWLLNHIADAARVLRPRNALLLFAEAAKRQGNVPDAGPILRPQSIVDALRDEVSRRAVDELKAEYQQEWSLDDVWLPEKFSAFERIWPVAEDALLEYLHSELKLPRERARKFVEHMVETGLIERRSHRKTLSTTLQIPDIYLYGLDLTRRG
jgi:CobQ/CobB/MinD/ParA nucleotide binding domain